MTPKEKAVELVKKMYDVHSNSASDITLHFAKQCALIAVDEIKKAPYNAALYGIEVPENSEDTSWYWDKYDQYWEQVKQEIEKGEGL